MADVTELSRDAYERLQSEYDDLTGRGRIEIARKIEVARELGDLSENGDYQAAKEEQGRMEGRIARLATILKNHKIIDPAASDGRVSVGVVVELRYEGDSDTERFLVGSIEERKDGVTVVSPTSPLGEALVGAKVGDVVGFEAPGGKLRVEVVSIEA
jgi:transcription elongation factor GreA